MKTVERYVDDSGREHETRQAAAAGDIALHLGVGISVAHDIVAKRHFIEAVFASLDTPQRWRGQVRGREAIRNAMIATKRLSGEPPQVPGLVPGVDITLIGGVAVTEAEAAALINGGGLKTTPVRSFAEGVLLGETYTTFNPEESADG